jgi:hypothetical protein
MQGALDLEAMRAAASVFCSGPQVKEATTAIIVM